MEFNKKSVYNCLKDYIDGLLEYQVLNIKDSNIFGAVICPACGLIHGRIADAFFPAMLLYKESKDKRYFDFAEKIINWSEKNIKIHTPEKWNGIWKNDFNNNWLGISAFSAISIGNTLFYFKDLLPSEKNEEFETLFYNLTDGVLSYFEYADTDRGNLHINYIAGLACLLALAFRLSGNEKYLKNAVIWEKKCRDNFDGDGLLFGESSPRTLLTAKNCRSIDMGYNLEETLPLLIQCSVWLGDDSLRRYYADKFKQNLEFLLPDGGIDNSFGTRHNKWTYWGSRTTDGMLGGLVHITDLDPVFAKAIIKNFELLKNLTKNKMLYGGLMTYEAGEPACIHHGFAHAKALAELFINMRENDFSKLNNVILPREREYGIKLFQNGSLAAVSVHKWRATVSAADNCIYLGAENFGGGLNLLWHSKRGPICAATMHRFELSEPQNMVLKRYEFEDFCGTPRLVCGAYSSDRDKSIWLEVIKNCAESAEIKATKKGELDFSINYCFFADRLNLKIAADKDCTYILPIIVSKTEKVKNKKYGIVTDKGLKVTADFPLTLPLTLDTRHYNQVGGFLYFPIEINISANKLCEINISVE